MKRRTDLPIMLGANMRKGVVFARDRHFGGGVNMFVVWLKNNYKSGESFETEDIDGLNAIIHFCDKSSVKLTIKQLQAVLDKWEED